MRKLCFIISLFLASTTVGQNLHMLSIEDVGASSADHVDKHVVTTDDGGFIIKISSLGFTNGNIPDCHNGIPGYQSLFRKYNADGTVVEWQKCYRPFQQIPDTAVHFLFPADNGNFYTVRAYRSPGELPKYFINLEDGNQNTIWSGPGYGNAQNLYLNTVCRASDGGFFLAFSSDFAGGDVPSHYGSNTFSDIWIVKLDDTGNLLWNKIIGGTYSDVAYKVLPAQDGGCFIGGMSASVDFDGIGNNGNTDAYVIRLDNNGNVNWHRCLGGPEYDYGYDLIDGGNGILYLAGSAGANGPFVHNHHGGSDMYFAKIDTAGNVLADNCFGGSFAESANVITQSTDGSIWLTGTSNKKNGQVDTSFGLGDIWTIKIDISGNFINSKVMGGTDDDRGLLLHALPSGVVLASGDYHSSAFADNSILMTSFGGWDVFISRFAPWTNDVKKIKKEKIGYKIFPNPADDILHVEFEPSLFSSLTICDRLGREVISETLTSKKTIVDIQQLTPGVYFIILERELGREVQMIVKY